MISLNSFLQLCDSLAQQARIFDDVMTTGAIAGGEPITGSGVGQGTANNQATIMATDDVQVAADLAPAFSAALAPNFHAAFYERLRALRLHVGGISEFLAANNARVDPRFSALLARVPPAQIFPPVVDPVASFAVTGSGAGAYTHAAGVDTTLYGPAALQVVATAAIGAQAITATLDLLTLAGQTVQKEVTVPANSAIGAVIAVDGGTINYTDCTGITITGGTNGDAFKVRTILERTIAL